MKRGISFLLSFISLIGYTQSPGGISSDLQIWFKANSGPSSTTNGSSFTTWNDQSGMGKDATRTGSSNQPTYTENWKNFYPAVYFPDGDDSYFTFDLDSIKNSNYTLITVSERDNNNTHSHTLGTLINSGNQGLHFGYRSNGQATLAQWGNDVNVNINDYNSPQAPAILVGQLDVTSGKTITEIRDGSSVSNSHSNTSPLTGSATGAIGRGYPGGFEGYIAEAIAYNSFLSSSQLEQIYSYLGMKYGITLNHNYSSSSSTILWNSTTNSSYNSNILAIGRDDDSGLNQRKGMSSESSAALVIEFGNSISTDESFIVVGSNGAQNTTTNSIPAGYTNRSSRIWKSEETGSFSNLTLKFVLPEMAISNTGVTSNYALLIDSDDDFSSGATIQTTNVSISGDTLIYSGVNLNDNYFAIGTQVTTKGPGGVSDDISVWLSADTATSTTSNGSTLSYWNDVSGNSNHAVIAGSSNYPTYATNTMNYNPAINFINGDNGYFNLDLEDIKNSDYSIFTVLERTNSNTESYILGTNIGSNNQGLHFGYRNNTAITLAQYGNDVNLSIDGYSANNGVSVLKGELNSTSGKTVSELRNGALISNSHSTTSFLTGNGSGRLGKGFSSPGFEGYCSEVIVYNGVLSSIDNNKVYTYLSIKYGLTYTDDYVSSDGTVIWDHSNLSTYSDYIIGVGRDDISRLSQRKSHSKEGFGISTATNFTSDEAYYILGSNNSSASSQTSSFGVFNNLSNRTWKSEVSGSVPNITFKFLLNEIGIYNTGDASDYALISDTDSDFSSGTSTQTSGISISGDTLIVSGISAVERYYRIAYTLDRSGPAGVYGGIVAWLKADSATSTNINNGTLSSWSDVSGSGIVASVTGSSNIPTYISSRHNDNPSVLFANGNYGYFDIDLSDIKDSDYTLITVLERTSGSSNKYILGTTSSSQNNGLHFGYRYNQTASQAHYANDLDLAVEAYDFENNVGILIGEFSTSTGKKITEIRNNSERSATQNNTSPLTGNAAGVLGRGFANGYGFRGYCSEVIIYNASLSSTDLEKVKTYLSLKYSISGMSNYIASDNTVIWNETTNSRYHNYIAGIGRDSDSFFNQTKSTNLSPDLELTIEAQTSLQNGEYLIWGSNNNGTDLSQNVPYTLSSNINTIWKFEEKGETGNLSLSFDLSGVSNLPSSASEFKLVVDSDTTFSNADTYSASSYSNDILTFNGINIDDAQYITIGIWNSIIWNGSSYSNGSGNSNAPNTLDENKRLYVNGSGATINEAADVLEIIVETGATLTINQNHGIIVSESIVNNGTINIENNASLIQSHDGIDHNSGTGSYNVKRSGKTNILIYNAWGSPVKNQQILGSSGVFKNTNPCDIFAFNAPTQSWKYDYANGFSTSCLGNNVTFGSNHVLPSGDGILDIGRGYFVPGYTTPERIFSGQINNGAINFSVSSGTNPGMGWTGDNWNLVSNPYPSAIDANSFITANTGIISANLYFWDQTAQGSNSESDYVVWNSAGSVNNNVGSGQTPGNIGAGQGFYVEALTNGNITFDNSMRNTTNNIFFKTEQDSIERIWISALNPIGRQVQQLIAFKDDATQGHDLKYDARYLEGDSPHHFYSLLNDEKMVIQGLPKIEFDETTVIPVGLDCDIAGKYRFVLDKTENISGDVYFFDSLLLMSYNMNEVIPEILFDTAGHYNDRFFIKYYKYSTTQDTSISTNIVESNYEDNLLIIRGSSSITLENNDQSPLGTIELFDLLGRKTYSIVSNNSKEELPEVKKGNYIIRIVRPDGKSISRKLTW